MVDSTFVSTSTVNSFFKVRPFLKEKYIIFASFLMDVMIVTFMTMFYHYWKSYRIVFAYILFFGTRVVLQVRYL